MPRSNVAIRLIAGLIVCTASAACGGSAAGNAWSVPSGRIDERAATPAPTHDCSRVGKSPEGDDLLAPPVPAVDARIDGWTLTVHWRFLQMPAECHAALLLVTANSVDDLGNMATAGDGGGIEIHGTEGAVSFNAPMLDLPPYEARVSALLSNGLRSPVTTVPVEGGGTACSDSKSVEDCVAKARELFQRCLTGAAPRPRCNPKAWRTQAPIPVERLQGISSDDLRRSLTATVDRMASDTNGLAIRSVRCNGTAACRVSLWNPGVPNTRFTILYTMSADSGGGSGCWIAARYRLVRAPRDTSALMAFRQWGNASTMPSGCTSWQ